MSYQVLARKWRPKDFSQLMGQEHVVTVLVNALMQERLHHAYLFTGTRGVGKTTIARIFAKSLNCQEGISANPCGKCDVCVDVDAGRFVDLLEIDAASRTKVDDTREILDNVQYAPTRGRFKVYLIDEVHMLSKHSFNALLKTLEEPPPHVKFILATTDPQKLPVTVLSRCLQFHLKALTPQQIETKLNEILTAEQVTFQDGALAMLAKAARGSMRDSLSLTDQAIAQGQGHIEVANVQQMLGGVDQNWVYKILIALIKQDPKGLLELSKSIASFAPSYHRLLAELLQLLHQVALWQLVPNSVDVDDQRATLLSKFAQAMSPEDVQLYYQIVLNGRKDLSYSSDEQAGFDMVVLRMLAFKPATLADTTSMPVAPADTTDFDDTDINDAALTGSAEKVDEAAEETEVSQAEANSTTADKTEVKVELSSDVEPQAMVEAAPEVVEPEKQSLAEGQALHQEKLPETLTMDRNADKSITDLNAEQQQLEVQAEQQLANVQQAPVEQHTAQAEAFEPQNSTAQSSTAQNPPAGTAELQTTEVATPESETIEPNPAGTDVEKMLATRNMLRSRKKAAEGEGAKKSEAKLKVRSNVGPKNPDIAVPQAEAASHTNVATEDNIKPAEPIDLPWQEDSPVSDASSEQHAIGNTQPNNVVAQVETTLPDVHSIASSSFDQSVIDPALIRNANQIDAWANTIDAMGLTGRVRQLALNANMDEESSDSILLINLDKKFEHLCSGAALTQITDCYSALKKQETSVQINAVDDAGATPFYIQSCINNKRLDYAKNVIAGDDFVQALEQQFSAFVDQNSIEAL
ncbi:DNA polymerase III subunit gamma/tau [Thalassotalea fonticola]|uniref:DNA-directed DNA polymerase n=1 Tax=Thalassotalea fonticola TaxID=3065649 RepID=A0ABZ0GTA6_9GAMM|nr:DNA polymerase III subunit gamma/tau [Colwelliaceae bacterium S1-1]